VRLIKKVIQDKLVNATTLIFPSLFELIKSAQKDLGAKSVDTAVKAIAKKVAGECITLHPAYPFQCLALATWAVSSLTPVPNAVTASACLVLAKVIVRMP
jgi:hypothetical protein